MEYVRNKEDISVFGMFFQDLPQHFAIFIFCLLKDCCDNSAKNTFVNLGDIMFYSR